MEKRALLAIALSFAVFFGYSKLLQIFYPNYGNAPQKQETTISPGPAMPAETRLAQTESFSPPSGQEIQGIIEDESIGVRVGEYDLAISESFGSIVALGFNAYEDFEKGGPLKFIEAADGSKGIGAIDLWVDGQYQDTSRFETTASRNVIEARLLDKKYEISKTINISKSNYGNILEVSFKNNSSKPMTVKFRIVAGSGVLIGSTIDRQYIEANWIGSDSVKHVKKFGKGKTKTSEVPFVATSIKSRHFSSILKPAGETVYLSHAEGLSKKDSGSYLISPEITLGPKEAWHDEYLLYMGPNRVEDLEPYGLGHVVNFGKLDPICKLLLGGMELIYKVVRNYGLAIILLTIFINILLMPLSKTSFMSMRRMQLVQPEMAKLREKYKKDSQKLNKEMMALYKRHKVNPMGGCLPMILQMPVFISLYVALAKSTELLGSNFLWVKNLAAPDNVPLPFTLPLVGNTLHILPLVMVVAMVFQQKSSQANMPQADPNVARQQKMMMTFMPIFFGYIFYPMPSGLVIYWLTNTVTMTAYQRFLRNQKVAPVPQRIR